MFILDGAANAAKTVGGVSCDTLLPLLSFLKNGVIPIIQFGIPIILIVLGMLDLGKAVIASKEDEIKNAQKLLIKRCIYAVAVFFVVLIVTVIFNLLGANANKGTNSNTQVTADKANSWTVCWNEA